MLFFIFELASPSRLFADEPAPAQQVSELMAWGFYSRALDFINEKITKNPNSAELYVARGAIYARTKKNELSMSDQNKALELMEKEPAQNNSMVKSNALHNRATLFVRMGKNQNAEHDYKDAVRIYPSNSVSYLELGKLQLGQRRFAEAKENLSKAKELFLKQSGTEEVEEADKLLKKVEKGLIRKRN